MIIKDWEDTDRIDPPKRDEVHIYKIDQSQLENQINYKSILHRLNQDELNRLFKYIFEKDRFVFGITRVSLKFIIPKILSIDQGQLKFATNQFGKPYLLDYENLQYNVSHSGNLILIAVGWDMPIGVDTEKHDPFVDHYNLAKTVFAKFEIDQLNQLSNKQLIKGFYNCWTKKESYIKAEGMGLSIPLDQFEVRIFDLGFLNLLQSAWNPSKANWQLFNFSIEEDYSAACCCGLDIMAIKLYDISTQVLNNIN